MKKTIASEIFYYNEMFINSQRDSVEAKRINEKSLKLYDDFRAGLTERQAAEFCMLIDDISQRNCDESEQLFLIGFKIGMRLAIETLSDT